MHGIDLTKTYEETYGGKVMCFLEASMDGILLHERALPEYEAIEVAAELQHCGAIVIVRKFGRIIYGPKS